LRKKKTDGVSGGRITQALIRGRFLGVLWLKNKNRIAVIRPVAFGEALPAGTRLTLFSDDKPDRFFTGDAVFCAPASVIKIINDGIEELVFYIITDNPVGETCYYPDSDKWGLPPNLNGPVLKGKAVDCFEGEE
jgi:hypothetical protein